MRKLLPFLLLLTTSCLAQGKGAWPSVQNLKLGQKVQVTDTAAKKHTGTVTAVTDEAIVLHLPFGDQSVPKQDVHTVKLLENNHRLRNTVIGAVIGAGAGAAILAAAWESNGFIKGKGTGAAVGLGLGGIVGAVVGVSIPTHQTIYATQ
jgi:hypothetical protein